MQVRRSKPISFVPDSEDLEWLDAMKSLTGLGRSQLLRRLLKFAAEKQLTFAVEVKEAKNAN